MGTLSPLKARTRGYETKYSRLVAVDVVDRALEPAQGEDREADREDDVLDEVRLPGLGAREARLAARPRGQVEQPDRHQHDDADHGHDADELDVHLERQEAADDRQRPVRLEELAVRLCQGRRERQETDRDEPVGEAHDPPPVHPGVAEELLDQGDRALLRVVGAAACRDRLTELHEAVDLRDGSGDERNADHGQDQRHDDRGELHLGAPRACEGGDLDSLLSGNLISPC